jgi:hypothetical protein
MIRRRAVRDVLARGAQDIVVAIGLVDDYGLLLARLLLAGFAAAGGQVKCAHMCARKEGHFAPDFSARCSRKIRRTSAMAAGRNSVL